MRTRAILVGVSLFVLFLVVRAPASLIGHFIDDRGPVSLLALDGTLWSGNGNLLIGGIQVGRLDWSFRPVMLLKGSLGYDLALTGTDIDVAGDVALGLGGGRTAVANGTVRAPFVNIWLKPYFIELSGTFVLDEVHAELSGRRLDTLSGTLTWDGGPLSYRLSGKMHRSALPPMRADLGPGPEATAYAQGESTPLLLASVEDNGFARFGVTKYLTKLVGEPWPGGDPDHAVVLEVEEQVF